MYLGCCLLVSASMQLASSRVWAQQSTPTKPSREPASATSTAAGPPSATDVQIGVGLHYGTLVSGPTPNPWSTGLGVALGYTLRRAVYLGGSFEYYFGIGAPPGAQMLSTFQYAAETGYDVGLGEHFVLRPRLGIGVASLTTSYNGCSPGYSDCPRKSDPEPLATPGLTFLFLNGHLLLSASVRYALVVPDAELQGFIFSFSIGGR